MLTVVSGGSSGCSVTGISTRESTTGITSGVGVDSATTGAGVLSASSGTVVKDSVGSIGFVEYSSEELGVVTSTDSVDGGNSGASSKGTSVTLFSKESVVPFSDEDATSSLVTTLSSDVFSSLTVVSLGLAFSNTSSETKLDGSSGLSL